MTKRSDGTVRRGQVASVLRAKLQDLLGEITEEATEGLSPSQAKTVQQTASKHMSEILSQSLEDFSGAEDPRQDRQMTTTSQSHSPYNPRLKILFLASDPSRTADGSRPPSALNLDREFRDIQQAIRAGKFRDQIDLHMCFAVTTQDFMDAINLHRPGVVHFSGHGSQLRGIALQNESGRPELVGNLFLAKIFATLAHVQVVVLNACFTQSQAEAISSVVPVTIGTQAKVEDDIAIAFSKTFYSALGNGLSVGHAYQQAEARLTSVLIEARPMLLSRECVEPDKLLLIRPPDATHFAQLAVSLERAMGEYFKTDSTRLDLLAKAEELVEAKDVHGETLDLKGHMATATSAAKGYMAGLDRIENYISEEVDRCQTVLQLLDGTSRRWIRFLDEAATSKFTELEQAVAELSEQLGPKLPLIRRAIEHLQRGLVNDNCTAESVEDTFYRLLRLLAQTRRTILATRINVAAYYNQLIELLPGDLLQKGLVKTRLG